MSNEKDKKLKIVKIEKKPIELTDKQIELKNKLQNLDKKIDDLQDIYSEIYKEDNNTMFSDDVISTITAQAAILASIDIISEYFEIDKNDLKDLL